MQSKLYRLAAVAVLAAAAVTAAVLLSSSGTKAPPAAAEPLVVAGLPERDGVLGDPDAPVRVVEFVDLQCPVCAAAARDLLPALIEHVRAARVKLEMRTLSFLGEDSVRAARVAAGAERQGRLWAFAEAFYARQGAENSGYVTDGFLREVAGAAGVDAEAALDHADGEFATERLRRAHAEAQERGVSGTPTFVVEREGAAPKVLDAGAVLAELER